MTKLGGQQHPQTLQTAPAAPQHPQNPPNCPSIRWNSSLPTTTTTLEAARLAPGQGAFLGPPKSSPQGSNPLPFHSRGTSALSTKFWGTSHPLQKWGHGCPHHLGSHRGIRQRDPRWADPYSPTHPGLTAFHRGLTAQGGFTG